MAVSGFLRGISSIIPRNGEIKFNTFSTKSLSNSFLRTIQGNGLNSLLQGRNSLIAASSTRFQTTDTKRNYLIF